MKTTNYTEAFIEVAMNCPATSDEVPPQKGPVASIQFEMIGDHPYRYTSDDD